MLRRLRWVGNSRKDFGEFPSEVKSEMGYALYEAQSGKSHKNAKVLKGMGDAGVLEIVEDFRGDTFRAVYTVRFSSAVYVLYAFQKKSVKGIATPKLEIDIIQNRLRIAHLIDKDTEDGRSH
jgi:phage-related protein